MKPHRLIVVVDVVGETPTEAFGRALQHLGTARDMLKPVDAQLGYVTGHMGCVGTFPRGEEGDVWKAMYRFLPWDEREQEES